jgi:hypothetical protein
MIKNFNEFVNESASTQKVKFSVYDEINEPFVDYIRQEELRIQQEQEDLYKHQRFLEEVMGALDVTIEDVKRDLEDIIVSEPTIKVDSDLESVEVIFDTNVSYAPTNDEVENEKFDEIESRVMSADQSVSKYVRVEFGLENAEGNYTLVVRAEHL